MVDALEPNDFRAIAEAISDDYATRKSDRRDLEAQWKDIDRQLEMKAKPRVVQAGQAQDWYPAIEEPLQFNALEVILADARAGIFAPSRTSWYTVISDVSDAYLEKNQGKGLVDTRIPTKLDQDSVDAIVKATIDYFHRMYDFRGRYNLFLSEQIKYGTGIGRVRDVRLEKFIHDHRGLAADETHGPAFLPYSIKQTYLDASPALTMHEGMSVAPVILRYETRLYEDLVQAARKGGDKRGWREQILKRLEPKKREDRRGTLDVIEAEGDFVVSAHRGRESIFLPNSRIMVVVGPSGPEVLRYETNPRPFHSTVVGHYMRQDVDSPYGVSPLMKGWPVQDAASFALNDLLAAGALNAQPPVAYDRNDSQFAARGGPAIFPRAVWATDNVDGIKPQMIGDPAVLLATYQFLQKKYEDLTQANDPRRGSGVKSHTTTGAVQIDTMRSLARTEQFVQDNLEGPLPSLLHMEYEIIREVMGKERSIPIEAEGMKGFIRVSKDLLPETVCFRVFGAAGVATEVERRQSFFAAANFALQLYAAAIQTGKPIDIDFVAMITEAFQIAGVQDAARFVARTQSVSSGPPGTTAVPGLGEVGSNGALAALQAFGGQA